MKFFKIFIVSNATVLATLLFLPALLVSGEVSIIDNMISSILKD